MINNTYAEVERYMFRQNKAIDQAIHILLNFPFSRGLTLTEFCYLEIFHAQLYCSVDTKHSCDHFFPIRIENNFSSPDQQYFSHMVVDFIGGGNPIWVTGENHRPAASHSQIKSHNVVSSTPLPWAGFELTTLVVIGTDCIGSCISNYHTIMTPLITWLPSLSVNGSISTTYNFSKFSFF